MTTPAGKQTLGLGLLSIGRRWGVRSTEPPSKGDAFTLLRAALSGGLRFFDTAPAYAASEALFGAFLSSEASDAERKSVTIATKAGEHWNTNDATTLVDHSYDALCRSLEQSLEHLGRVDVLQIHKADASVIQDKAVERLVAMAQAAGVREIGVSVSNPDAIPAAFAAPWCSWIQCPFNFNNRSFEGALRESRPRGMKIIVNRPFAMGKLVDGGDITDRAVDAFRFVLSMPFDGVVLTGTRSAEHLRDNIRSFRSAKS